jgi:hypothetical protein
LPIIAGKCHNIQQYGSNFAKKITDLYKRNKVKVNMLAISSNIQQYGSNLGPRKLPTPIEGRREVTLTEAFFRLDSRLHLTEQSPTSVEWVPVGLGEAGQVALSQAKQHYSLRPGDWEHLTLCQMMMWYRGEKPGEEAANAQQGPAVPLVMAAHLALPAISFLPPVLLLEGGTRLRRLRKPRAVDWTPRTEYGQLVMFRVSKQINMVTVIDGETLCLY